MIGSIRYFRFTREDPVVVLPTRVPDHPEQTRKVYQCSNTINVHQFSKAERLTHKKARKASTFRAFWQ